MKRVVVGMSGGVDSAVTAYLLKAAGFDVIGITLRTWSGANGEESRCCEIGDAMKVAQVLDIPYYAQNSVGWFQEHVVEPFIAAYLKGRTPNPCVECNRIVKWELMMQAAARMRADYVATGHYASPVCLPNGRYTVQQSVFVEKDQTYMLYRLTQEQLAHTIMPLGKLSKKEVRLIAEKAGLPVAHKKDSQEICFVARGGYADFIENEIDMEVPPEGNFVDTKGNIVGKHRGIIHYTVGQRKGLGLALGYPAYVKAIDVDRNEVVVGDETSLYSRAIICEDLNFLSIPELPDGEPLRARVKIRYHHAGEGALITPGDRGTAKVVFDVPVRAAAPGQSAVFYDENNCVIGGGIIAGAV